MSNVYTIEEMLHKIDMLENRPIGSVCLPKLILAINEVKQKKPVVAATDLRLKH